MEPAVIPFTKHRLDAGFTLIELVVVVAVMASLVLGVTLSQTRGGGDSDLVAFRSAYEQARSLAIHGRVRRGMELSATGRRLARWQVEGWQISGQLMPWRGPVSYQVEGPPAPRQAPNLLFLPTGQTSAFSIQFGRISCRSDGWRGLICDAG